MKSSDRLPEVLRENDELRQELARTRIHLRKALTQIEDLMVDGLTGIYNRAGLDKVLAETLKHDTAAIIYIDLDQFKPINDNYGHDAGDKALEIVGQLLNKNIKSDTDIIALLEKQHGLQPRKRQKSNAQLSHPSEAMRGLNTRIGGDEFVIVLDGVSENNAQSVLERIKDAFEGLNFDWKGQTIEIGASFGMAIYHKGESFEAAKSRADEDMFDKKRAKGHAPRR